MFVINLTALIAFAIIPKLPQARDHLESLHLHIPYVLQLHRQRVRFLPDVSEIATPVTPSFPPLEKQLDPSSITDAHFK